MPVFKKQQSEKRLEEEKKVSQVSDMMMEPQMEQPEPTEMEICEDDDMGLMPDPIQFSLMMAPPPPPIPTEENRSEEILPPGIDETEQEFIPKPISEAPQGSIPRKGPLPQDFQDTLNLLFDADKNLTIPEFPKVEPVVAPIDIPVKLDEDQPHMMSAEDVYGIQSPFIPVPPSPPNLHDLIDKRQDENEGKLHEKQEIDPSDIPIPPRASSNQSPLCKLSEETNGTDLYGNEETKKDKIEEKHNGIDLAEMALLGIDIDDLACINFTKNWFI